MTSVYDELIQQADECRKLAGDIRAVANVAVEELNSAQLEEMVSKLSFENQCMDIVFRRLREAIQETMQ